MVLNSLSHVVKIALIDHMIKQSNHCIRSLVKGHVCESKVAFVANPVLSQSLLIDQPERSQRQSGHEETPFSSLAEQFGPAPDAALYGVSARL